MHVDIDKYEASKHIVMNFFNGKAGRNIKKTISMGAQMSGVPCIVIAYWLGPETNWHPEVISSIKSLVDFYGYKEIKGKPEGSPI